MVGLAIAIPAVAPLLDRFARYLQGSIRGWRGAFDELIRAAVMIAFLPHQAWLSVDAIVRVTYRRWFSRHHLLEWQTAESASRAHSHFTSTMRQMLMVSGFSVVLMIVMRIQSVFAPTAIFLVLWALSPLLMQWLARPVRSHSRQRFQKANSAFLRTLARRTWRYFDDLVGPAMNWLPPDNSQLALHIEVAPRTSPTNIGLWLTSALAARDFGYLTADDFCRRCSQTIDTLDRLERYEGHLLNWYDTQTLKPLEPRYVSTVDSGNLLACLWVLEQGCQDAIRAPVLGQQCMRGLVDTLSILREACGPNTLAGVHLGALRRLLRGKAEGYALIGRLRLAVAPLQQLREIERGAEASYWASRLEFELKSWIETVELYLKWMETLMRPPEETVQVLGTHVARLRRRAVRAVPSLHALASGHSGPVDEILTRRLDPGLPSEVSGWLNQLATEYQEARTNAARSVANLQRLAASAERLAGGMNMRFLYDQRRRLFGIGYVVGSPAGIHQPLRPAGQRIPPREPGGHGQRRRSRGALVRARPPRTASAGRPDTALLERHHLRIPDAGAVHAHVLRTRCSKTPAATPSTADRLRRAHESPLGHLRIRLQRARRQSDLSISSLRRAATGAEARPGRRRPGDLALLDNAGASRPTRRRVRQPEAPGRTRPGRPDGTSTKPSTSPARLSATANAAWSFTPTWRTTRA